MEKILNILKEIPLNSLFNTIYRYCDEGFPCKAIFFIIQYLEKSTDCDMQVKTTDDPEELIVEENGKTVGFIETDMKYASKFRPVTITLFDGKKKFLCTIIVNKTYVTINGKPYFRPGSKEEFVKAVNRGCRDSYTIQMVGKKVLCTAIYKRNGSSCMYEEFCLYNPETDEIEPLSYETGNDHDFAGLDAYVPEPETGDEGLQIKLNGSTLDVEELVYYDDSHHHGDWETLKIDPSKDAG